LVKRRLLAAERRFRLFERRRRFRRVERRRESLIFGSLGGTNGGGVGGKLADELPLPKMSPVEVGFCGDKSPKAGGFKSGSLNLGGSGIGGSFAVEDDAEVCGASFLKSPGETTIVFIGSSGSSSGNCRMSLSFD
jgi:hypothetical protein